MKGNICEGCRPHVKTLQRQYEERISKLDEKNSKLEKENKELRKKFETLEKYLKVYENPHTPSSKKRFKKDTKKRKQRDGNSSKKYSNKTWT